MRTRAATALLVACDAVALATTAAAPVAAWRDLHDPRLADSVDRAAADLVGAALFVAALWLAAGLLAGALSVLPGTAGAVADRLTRLLLPSVLYRVVAGTAGLGVLLAPVVADAATATSGATSSGSAPVWPTGSSTATTATPAHDRPAHDRPARRSPAADPPTADAVRVAPGDSLWLIADRRLGPHATDARVARLWPRIYSANRAVVGADPALIHPGQRLTLPAVTAEEQS